MDCTDTKTSGKESNMDNSSNGASAKKSSKVEKTVYFAVGVTAGVVLYPAIKQGLEKFSPAASELFGAFLGKAETILETSSDLMAKARSNYKPQTTSEVSPTESCSSEAGSCSSTKSCSDASS